MGPPTTVIWPHINFQDGGRQPGCICFGVMADHPRSAFRGLNSVVKSLVRRINSSRDIAINYIDFGVFGLKLPSHPFSRSFWAYFPRMTSLIAQTPKRTVLGKNTSFEPFSVRTSTTVRPGRVNEKKRTGQQKSHKSVIFSLFKGSPHWTDSTKKLHGEWCPRRNHVCQVSNWNLHVLRFYMGSNFWFSHWFLHGPYNSAALMRCLWCNAR